MEAALITALIGGLVAVIAALLGLIGVLAKNGSERRTALEARLDKRIDDALAGQAQTIEDQGDEIKTLKSQVRAVGRVLRRTIAVNPDLIVPDTDPADIALLEDTEVLPSIFIRRNHTT